MPYGALNRVKCKIRKVEVSIKDHGTKICHNLSFANPLGLNWSNIVPQSSMACYLNRIFPNNIL